MQWVKTESYAPQKRTWDAGRTGGQTDGRSDPPPPVHRRNGSYGVHHGRTLCYFRKVTYIPEETIMWHPAIIKHPSTRIWYSHMYIVWYSFRNCISILYDSTQLNLWASKMVGTMRQGFVINACPTGTCLWTKSYVYQILHILWLPVKPNLIVKTGLPNYVGDNIYIIYICKCYLLSIDKYVRALSVIYWK